MVEKSFRYTISDSSAASRNQNNFSFKYVLVKIHQDINIFNYVWISSSRQGTDEISDALAIGSDEQMESHVEWSLMKDKQR